MPDDSRIMQGSELPVAPGTLDNVIVGAPGSSVARPNVPVQTVDFGSQYTLNAHLISFLKNTCREVSLVSKSTEGPVNGFDLFLNQAIENLVLSLGADFFTLDELEYHKSYEQKRDVSPSMSAIPSVNFLTAQLKVADNIPIESFKKGVITLIGSEEVATYLLSTDLAHALGLNDTTKPVNLNDPQLQQYFPDLAPINRFGGRYVVPLDAYLLLLAVDPKYRRFLSACFDGALSDPVSNYMSYSNSRLDKYGFDKSDIDTLASGGLISLATIAKVGHQYGIKEIKPYIDALNQLKATLAGAKMQ